MKTIKIVPRLCKATKRIELFYYDDRKDLVCVNKNEGHSTACYAYYLQNTKTVPHERMTEANKFVKNYIGTDDFFIQSQKLK